MTTTTVLRPGDKVLVTFAENVNLDTVQHITTQLRERFPDVEFTSLSGVESVVVQPAEEEDQ